ncbi:MAG: hypothetical protein GY788_03805 [bacterium]|nr:hypothetical protein [bacterium]
MAKIRHRRKETLREDRTRPLGNDIRIDDEGIRDRLKHIVRGSVEETLNALLNAEADRCRPPESKPRPGRWLPSGAAAVHVPNPPGRLG